MRSKRAYTESRCPSSVRRGKQKETWRKIPEPTTLEVHCQQPRPKPRLLCPKFVCCGRSNWNLREETTRTRVGTYYFGGNLLYL